MRCSGSWEVVLMPVCLLEMVCQVEFVICPSRQGLSWAQAGFPALPVEKAQKLLSYPRKDGWGLLGKGLFRRHPGYWYFIAFLKVWWDLDELIRIHKFSLLKLLKAMRFILLCICLQKSFQMSAFSGMCCAIMVKGSLRCLPFQVQH